MDEAASWFYFSIWFSKKYIYVHQFGGGDGGAIWKRVRTFTKLDIKYEIWNLKWDLEVKREREREKIVYKTTVNNCILLWVAQICNARHYMHAYRNAITNSSSYNKMESENVWQSAGAKNRTIFLTQKNIYTSLVKWCEQIEWDWNNIYGSNIQCNNWLKLWSFFRIRSLKFAKNYLALHIYFNRCASARRSPPSKNCFLLFSSKSTLHIFRWRAQFFLMRNLTILRLI